MLKYQVRCGVQLWFPTHHTCLLGEGEGQQNGRTPIPKPFPKDYPSLTVIIQVREVVIKWLLNEGPARNSSGIGGRVNYLLCYVFQRRSRLEIRFAGGTCHKAWQQETGLGFHCVAGITN